MEELIKRATKFLEDNPFVNEIELTDPFGSKVRLIRNSPVIWQLGQPIYSPTITYSRQYQY